MHPNRILLYGVARRSGRGLPDCVLQEEKVTKTKKVRVRGTVKDTKLTGDPGCPNLLAVSVYDTKAENIEWGEKKRSVQRCREKNARHVVS